MPEKNFGESAANQNNLTQEDCKALREYYELLDRWKVRSQSNRKVINGLLNQNLDMENEEQGIIGKMSEEGRRLAREMKASAASYLVQPGKSEVM